MIGKKSPGNSWALSKVRFASTRCLTDLASNNFRFITELQLGELVHHQTLFGLLEAMSAIEMMDPKMDAGLRCNKDPEGPLTFSTAVAVSECNWKKILIESEEN